MTFPSPQASSPSDAVKGLRPLFAWALLAYTALRLFFSFLSWIVNSDYGSFAARSANAGFVGLYTIVLPLVAVLIATQIQPALRGAKLIAMVALGEYAFALLFGALTFLISLLWGPGGSNFAAKAVNYLSHVVLGALELGLMLLAAFAVLRVFTSLGGQLPKFQSGTPKPPATGDAPTQPLN
ncbi:hypothetical protein [Hamadaea tsunoensis]|uniref:hypothetical protein n=1 Tax=Hamadaea tsunoensis TaxID=53368 RepID=UPI0003FFCD56|nr:hypothetical protein [Hamadaea tsunoensis]